jgi:phage terminase large subunit-like protein
MQVWAGVDLSMTNDNCSVAIVGADEDENIFAEAMIFIPEGRIDEKSRFEKIDYRQLIAAGECIACGDMTVDYSVIEDYVLSLEDRLGCTLTAIGYDRYNAMSSAQKWNNAGYNAIEIRQHSDTLHAPTKLLSETIDNNNFFYKKSKLYEINYQNAKCTYDTNLNRYVSKKKSNGKIDAVIATINAICLMQQDIIFNDDFFVQSL